MRAAIDTDGPAGVKTARSAFASLSRAPVVVDNHSMSDWSNEETDDPLVADARNFYKVEKWTGDGLRVVDPLIVPTRSLPPWSGTGRASG